MGSRYPREPLCKSLKKHLEVMTPLEMAARQGPRRFKAKTVEITVQAQKVGHNPRPDVLLTLHTLVYRAAQDLWVAHLPQLGIEVTAPLLRELPRAITREARSWLQRNRRPGSQPNDRVVGLGRLEELVMLDRWQTFSLESVPLSVALAPPQKATEPQSQLRNLTSPLHSGRHQTFEREELLIQLAELIAEHNVLLVGPSGSGKSALVAELVRQRNRLGLGQTAFFSTTGPRLLFGEASFGGWQERVQHLIQELHQLKAILHLGTLQELLESGRHSTIPYGMAGFLKAPLQAQKLRAIAESTPEQLTHVEREYPQILEAFSLLRLEATTPAQTRKILELRFPQCTPNALETAAELHERFAGSSASPGWPVRLLQRTLLEHPDPTPTHLMQSFSRQSSLPMAFLDEQIPLERETMRGWLQSRLHGQDVAIERVVDRLAAFKAGLTRPQRPIASFLLVGPTGVGKTELARCLAELVFQDRQRLTRLDMSEYADPWSVQRLLGGAEMGLLVGMIRDHPFQVVLFDELEKADPSFFDLLLQILGEARLTDAAGRLADFSNCLILMTSNLGAESAQKGSLGLREQQPQGAYLEAVRAAFRPELLNRLDEIIPFEPLSLDTVVRICAQELSQIPGREGLRQRPVKLDFQPGLDRWLAERSYDRRYGARPLKRIIDRTLVGPLSEHLNRWPAHQPLEVKVEIEHQELKLSAHCLTTPEKTQILQQKGHQHCLQVSSIRRNYRKFVRGSILSELANEQNRHQRKHPYPWPHSGFLKGIEELGPELEHLEELALNALGDPAQMESLTPLALELQAKLRRQMMEAFSLSVQPSDRILLALFSESKPSLLQLTQAYLSCFLAQQWKVDLEQICLNKQATRSPEPPLPARLKQLGQTERAFQWTKQGWTRHPELERLVINPEQIAGENSRALGYLLEIQGKHCAAWIRGEQGLHCHIHRGREFRVLVEVSQHPLRSGFEDSPYAPPAYQPPVDVHRKGSLNHPVVVRRYYQDEQKIQDPLVGDHHQDFKEVWNLEKILQGRLEMQSEKAVLE